MKSYTLIFVSICLVFAFLNAFVNATLNDISIKSLQRKIALDKFVVRENLSATIKNNGKENISQFILPLEELNHLSRVVPSSNRNTFTVSKNVQDNVLSGLEIVFKNPIRPNGEASIVLELVYVDRLVPKPTEIKQSEKQRVVFRTKALAQLPYFVETQSVILELPKSSSILDFTKRVKGQSARQSDNTITYGPFTKAEATSTSATGKKASEIIAIHYENNFPFVKIENLSRLLELSMWGNLAIEEQYVIKHAGAQLEGGFSRFDYQAGNPSMTSPSSFQSIVASIPYEATDIYYRDRIGNISTSDVKPQADKKKTNVIIQPRYPMFGGWKSTFTFGYNVPISPFLKKSGSHFILTYNFGTSFPETPIENYELKVLLPEGATNIKFVLDQKELVPNLVEQTQDIFKTYLDTKGRPVLIINKKNVAPELSALNFDVEFEFSSISMLQEPLLVIGTLFTICILSMIYVRFDFKIAKTPSQIKKEQQWETYALIEKYVSLQVERDNLYRELESSSKKSSPEVLGKASNTRESIETKVQTILTALKQYHANEVVTTINLIEQKEQEKFQKLKQIFEIRDKVQNKVKVNDNEIDKLEKVYDELTEEISNSIETLL